MQHTCCSGQMVNNVCSYIYICYAQRLKMLNEQQKDHNTLWHYSNSHNKKFHILAVLNTHNAVWHVKKCHDVELASWLLKEMTTMHSSIMKIPQYIVVVSFYSHDAMREKL